jgi:protein-S-isoprenylcysteine O-methyltransferase Ste14
MRPGLAIAALWTLWLISWLVAALWSNPTEKRAGIGSEFGYRALMTLGAIVLLVPAHRYEGPLRLWYIGWVGAWICVLLVALGLGFSWWARIYLGRLWSSGVTRKADHHLVDAGPYAIVRHPIYTGLLLAILATTAAKGTVLGIAGCLSLVIGVWLKARLEERWLARELGEGTYQSYRQRVPMLVPFAPSRRG